MATKAFLEKFEDDIFISYAHLDDVPLTEGQKGWVSAFHHTLEVLLRQRLGAEVKVWRDPKLTGNDAFADKLMHHLPRVATLVAVLSPGYLNSEWCNRELGEFVRQAAATGGVRVADKARIFNVQRTQVELSECPEELRALLGYKFFEIDSKTGRPREFAPDRDVRQFLDKLNDLAFDIRDLLRLLRNRDDPARAATADAPVIYLAEASSDQASARDRIRRELLDRGYWVLPDRPLPLQARELRRTVSEDLARAHLSVHLLGAKFGAVPEDETRSLAAVQVALAGERLGGAPFARLIWIPPDVCEIEKRQQAFIDEVQDREAAIAGTDVLASSIEELKAAIEDKLARRRKPAPPAPVSPATEHRPTRVYLIADPCDLNAAQPVADALFDRGCEVILPAAEGDEAQVREDHKENLALCDAALIFQAQSSELWLRAKLRDLQKAAGFGRTHPLGARAVLLAGEETPARQRFRTLEAMVIKQFGAFDPAVLGDFIAAAAARPPAHG